MGWESWICFAIFEVALLLWCYRTRRWSYLGMALVVLCIVVFSRSNAALNGALAAFSIVSLSLEWNQLSPRTRYRHGHEDQVPQELQPNT
jgi:hypothetical protein